METEAIDLVTSIIDTGLVGVVLVQSIILYRALAGMTDRYLANLERMNERLIAAQFAQLSRPPFLDGQADANRAQPDNITI